VLKHTVHGISVTMKMMIMKISRISNK